MLKEFVIPLSKDELLQSHAGQYVVEDVIPLHRISQAIDGTKTALHDSGADFIIDHFDTFFSLVVHGHKIELLVAKRAFERIHKAVRCLVKDFEVKYNVTMEFGEEERQRLQCINKMLAYLFSWFICHIDDRVASDDNDSNTGNKRKKAGKKSDIREEWDETKQRALEVIHSWIQLPLQTLWQPPIVEDSFIGLFTQICYKTLEFTQDTRNKFLRQTIFDILGVLVKKYNHGMICMIKIIQLVKLYEPLAMPLANGVTHMVSQCGCTGLVKEIVKEIEQNESEETENRRLSLFLENIAEALPNSMLPLINHIIDYLSNESYPIRNCALGILGIIVEKTLTSEELTHKEKNTRDECLYCLQEHLLDCNAFVRSKALQIWQRLCCETAIPKAIQGNLVSETVHRLKDKSAIVRKQALRLLRALLQSNPFCSKLDTMEIEKTLEKEENLFKELQISLVRESAKGDEKRIEVWNRLLPDVRRGLKKFVAQRRDKSEDDGNELDDDDEEDISNINFENIRQLMLNENVDKAVMNIGKISDKLIHTELNGKNFDDSAKEEYLYLFLLEIFMQSETNPVAINRTKSREMLEKKEKMESQRTLVIYLETCLEFAREMEKAIPLADHLLFSTTVGDAVEACSFLGVARQFRIAGTENSMGKALFQICHSDQSVRDNLAIVYKDLYLNQNDVQGTDRQKALICVNGMIKLCKQLEPGQSRALTQLIGTWYSNKELGEVVLQILWEKFSMKLAETTELESRAALMLITMIAQTEMNVIICNLEVLIKIGFGQRSTNDLLLARDTCRALLKIKPNKSNDKKLIRYPNDHEIFKSIKMLLFDNFLNLGNNNYVSFSTDAINVIYHLANKPDTLINDIVKDIWNKKCSGNGENSTITYGLLARFLHLIGHMSIKEMVHLDTSVYRELKRRNTLRESKNNRQRKDDGDSVDMNKTPASACKILRHKEINQSSSTVQDDNGESAVEGATDDTDAEFIHATLETGIISGDPTLAHFVPLVLEVCRHPDKYDNEHLQAAGVLALTKMMTVSSIFCEESLQLLVTILERSKYSGIRSSVLIGMSDLTTVFPNQVEPWIKHLYGRLGDPEVEVRRTCVRMLSNLIMREMVRVKGQISELALCIVDEDVQINQETRQFFKNISEKGNSLYNVLPDILSRLSDPSSNLEENKFQEIIKYILGLIHKERQVDNLIEKLCTRLKLSTLERQSCDLLYCLSLLQCNKKSIKCLIDALPFLKDKIHYQQVYKYLLSIIAQASKKPDTKVYCIELKEKLQNMLDNNGDTRNPDQELMPPPSCLPKRKSKQPIQSKLRVDEDDEDDEDRDSDLDQTNKSDRDKRIEETPARPSRKRSTNSLESPQSDTSNASLTRKTSGRSRKTPRRK